MVIASMVMVGLACEDHSPPPIVEQQAREQEVVTQQSPAPTTQELLTGPYRRIQLADWPLSIEAPQSWKIETDMGGFIFLQGHAPHGPVQIQLAKRPSLSPDKLDQLVKAARADAAADPRRARSVELREATGFQLLERKGAEPTVTVPQVDDQGNPIEIEHTPYSWTLNVLIPRGDELENHELNFYDLTRDQYEADRAFLEKIIDSIRPDAAAAPTPGL